MRKRGSGKKRSNEEYTVEKLDTEKNCTGALVYKERKERYY